MAQQIVYRVPRRYITVPVDPPPYGFVLLSVAAHLFVFLVGISLAAFLGKKLDQSKVYIVNLVPAAPVSQGSPTPRAAQAPVAPRPAPERTPPPPPKAVERTPPRPEESPPKAVERTPPRPDPPPPRTLPPRELPPRELVRAAPAPPRPADLALPRRAERETPALDAPGVRERLVDRPLPPPPAAAPPPPPPARLPEPPRLAAAPPVPVPAVPPPPTTVAKAGVDPVPLGRPTAGPASRGSIALDVSDFPFTYYLRQIQAKISERWTPPRAGAAGGERAIVLFEIGRDGSIREPALERSSGNAVYDQSALRAVAEASPFPPLPPEFKAGSLRVHFGFEYQPDQG